MNVLAYFKKITTFIFDVDGVLTDGSLLLFENGLQARTMNIKDGLALQMAIKNGYRVIIISGANSDPVLKRLEYLGLKEIHLGIADKLKFAKSFVEQHKIPADEILFMGDDLPDLPLLGFAGLPACPSDAAMEVKKICKYISPVQGGHGCVRDVIEKVLRLNFQWNYHPAVSSR